MLIDFEGLKAEAAKQGTQPNGHDPDPVLEEDAPVSYDALIAATRDWAAGQPDEPSRDAVSDWIASLFAGGVDPTAIRGAVVDTLVARWSESRPPLRIKDVEAMWREVAAAFAPPKNAPASNGAAPEERVSPVEELEPWPDPVSGYELANEISDQLKRSVVMSRPADSDALTLWIVGTYLMDCWYVWPKLVVFSPTRECGKTRLLEVIEALSCRALLSSNITAASLFRMIEAHRPTIILDEADRFMRDKSELVGIMNSGHNRRTARVLRSVPTADGGYEVQAMSTWAAQVLGGIGADWVDHALRSRSVEVRLERKDTETAVQRLGARYFDSHAATRSQLLRWATDTAIGIGADTAEPPNLGNDRRQDNWTPLLRIARALGGDWPARCLVAYRAMSRDGDDDDSELQLLMLADLRTMMKDRKSPMMVSADIVRELLKLDSSPWSELRGGKGISTHGVARLLKPFGIRPKQFRDGVRAGQRGYTKADIERVAARYLPATEDDPS